ncbi:hypothetical protein TrRE_jg8125 [Triparma retinervis]|uniref:Uncharacterized protein n=1 Tax=Triparma retinervis TaxID=2557542 RepID=A0A9W7DZ84_9STRA|nr:hypothetical protein TrRE_jg8125 [Triparma retinervis]
MVEADGGVCDVEPYGKFNNGFYHTDALKGVRNLVLAMRKATSFIHRNPKLAMHDYAAYAKRVSPSPGRNLLSFLNPFAWARCLKAKKAELATMKATLPAFPNDNTLSSDFNDQLMSWLVQSGQVGKAEAELTPPSKYYTNEIAT